MGVVLAFSLPAEQILWQAGHLGFNLSFLFLTFNFDIVQDFVLRT
jgi:hypothetical protein